MSEKESFYVSPPSTGSRAEFPNNKANDFKVRLPHQLHLRGGEWEVGLVSLSTPDEQLALSTLIEMDGDFLFKIGWQYKPTGASFVNEQRKYEEVDLKYLKYLNTAGLTGITFMRSVINYFEAQRLGRESSSPRLGNDYEISGKRTYIKFKWECNCTELVTDNEDTDKDTYPNLYIDKKFAEKMGWIVPHWKNTSTLILGPNLLIKHFTDVIPDGTVGTHDVKEGAYKRFWKVDGNSIRLSNQCDWRFINLDAAFKNVLSFPRYTIFVYSDVAKSSVVGNQVTDMLREVKGERKGEGEQYFEPVHIHYKEVRNDQLDIIHTQVAKKDGTLYPFEGGTTTVTLHFRKKKPRS